MEPWLVHQVPEPQLAHHCLHSVPGGRDWEQPCHHLEGSIRSADYVPYVFLEIQFIFQCSLLMAVTTAIWKGHGVQDVDLKLMWRTSTVVPDCTGPYIEPAQAVISLEARLLRH